MAMRAAEIIFKSLEEDIVTGVVSDGERLDESSLCARFNLSRTPIREALEQLVGSGLAKKIPKRGCFVQVPSVKQLIEMFEVMSELEAVCARLAARRITHSQLEELRQANKRCEEAIAQADSDTYYEQNVHFHEIIYAACGNSFLAEETRQLRSRLRVYRRLQLRVNGRMRQSLAEHRAMISAIENSDENQAEKLSRAHVRVQGERFNDLISQL
ncbi:MAG TPA: GntR family transcriptional regulator [Marinobacterium sp.]|nr:GntR family transcriptional regulator [Marinobacterium sp.]